MRLDGIFLTCLIIGIIYCLSDLKNQVGGDCRGALPVDFRQYPPYYIQQYKELGDINNVLKRPVHPHDDTTEKLVAENHWTYLDGIKRTQLELITPPKRFLDFKDKPTANISDDEKVMVEDKQHYFLDDSLIIDYDGKKFYWDYRYPRKPISIEFAKDPVKYIQDHPKEYPSYVIKARDFSQLKSNTA